MKHCLPPSQFTPANAQKPGSLPLECVIGYHDSPPPRQSLWPVIRLGLCLGAAMACIGILVASILAL